MLGNSRLLLSLGFNFEHFVHSSEQTLCQSFSLCLFQMRVFQETNDPPPQLLFSRHGWGTSFRAVALWAGWSIVAVGTGRSGLDGGNLIGDVADREWAGLGAVAFQFLDDVFAVARAIVAGEAGKGLGQNVVVVYVFQTRFPGDIQPQAMKQDDVLILHGRRVRADAESADDAVGLNDLKYKLPFGFRYGFPGAAEGECLLGGSHFAWEAGDDAGGLEVVGGLGDGRPGVASWHHQERDL